MQSLSRGLFLALLLTAAAGLPAPEAAARDICAAGAIWEYKECRLRCLDPFPARLEACIPSEAACVQDCRVARDECQDAVALDLVLRTCDAARNEALAACSDAFEVGSRGYERCVHLAQVEARRCRSVARRASRPELKRCRLAFGTCAQRCERTPAGEEIGACRRDTVERATQCQVSCADALRATLPACRERERPCVDECQAERRSCERDAERSVDLERRGCALALIAATDACHDAFPPDTPEHLACLSEARLAAFECREDLRARVEDELAACRDESSLCIEFCPELEAGEAGEPD
jgi:hypothetical protein